jgi:signal transduction histidine kinase
MPAQKRAFLERHRVGAALVRVRSWTQERPLRVAAALALAIAVPLAGLFYLELRSLSALEAAWTTVLSQISRQAVDGAIAQVEQGFQVSYAEALTLGRVRADLPDADLPRIARVFQDALNKDPLADRFYLWAESAPRAAHLLAYDREHTSLLSDVPEGPRLLATIRALAMKWQHTALSELGDEGRTPFAAEIYYHTALFELDVNGRRTYFVARMYYSYRTLRAEVPTLDTRLASFVAFSVDDAGLRTAYMPSLMAKLSHAALPLRDDLPPLMLTVTDDRGTLVFPSVARAPRVFVDERPIPLAFYSPPPAELAWTVDLYSGRPPIWRIRSTYGDQTIPEIVASRTRPMRATVMALGALMLLCVAVVAVAAAREIRLAELKSSFVASVSHDLKTPLSLIRLFAESVELGRVDAASRVREYASVINTQAGNLSRLIDNILDFSRIEAGLREYSVALHDLGELTAGVVASMTRQFEQEGFTVTSHIASDLRPVNVDPLGITQALENVLLNAMKYSGSARSIEVHVDETSLYSRIRVTDHGIGIPQALQRKIFRKFYRIHSGPSSGPQGCGLGLAIVDHVVRAHGGFIAVESAPGQGSTFALHFPFATEVARVETNPSDRGRAADAARSA